MTPDDFRQALALPAAADVDRRVPKNAFMEQIKGTTDRKQFDQIVERIDWLATLAPGTIGVSAAVVDGQAVEEVQLFAATFRREPTKRLLQVIHQTLPYPLILLCRWADQPHARLSLLPGYRPDDGIAIDLVLNERTEAFPASLDLSRLPRTDLAALYDGLVERAQALWASDITGANFRVPATGSDASTRKEALAAYLTAEAEWRKLKAQVRNEKRLAQAVELGDKARRAKLAMDEAAKGLR